MSYETSPPSQNYPSKIEMCIIDKEADFSCQNGIMGTQQWLPGAVLNSMGAYTCAPICSN